MDEYHNYARRSRLGQISIRVLVWVAVGASDHIPFKIPVVVSVRIWVWIWIWIWGVVLDVDGF